MSERLKTLSPSELVHELRKIYCVKGAQFCRYELEAAWLCITTQEAEIRNLKRSVKAQVWKINELKEEINNAN